MLTPELAAKRDEARALRVQASAAMRRALELEADVRRALPAGKRRRPDFGRGPLQAAILAAVEAGQGRPVTSAAIFERVGVVRPVRRVSLYARLHHMVRRGLVIRVGFGRYLAPHRVLRA